MAGMGGMAAGAVLRIAGAVTGGIAADQRRGRYENFMSGLAEPNVNTEEGNYFNDLKQFYDPAAAISKKARQDELTQDLALREQALPGITKATQGGMDSISALMRGELPQGVLDSFARAGGASTLGTGMGGSGFGFLNTGLFGARGSLGAIQTGMGLLPTLLHTMPNLSAPTTMGLLNNLLNPQQRVNLQMQLRQQKIGMENTLEEMPTALDSWSSHLNESGAMLMGGGGASMGMGGGMGGSSKAGSRMPGQDPESGTWGSAYPYGSTTQPSGGLWGSGE